MSVPDLIFLPFARGGPAEGHKGAGVAGPNEMGQFDGKGGNGRDRAVTDGGVDGQLAAVAAKVEGAIGGKMAGMKARHLAVIGETPEAAGAIPTNGHHVEIIAAKSRVEDPAAVKERRG